MKRLASMALAGLLLALAGAPALAQDGLDLAGTVRNGTPQAAFDPTSVRVTLTILEGVVSIDQRTLNPEADGGFVFMDVPVGTGRIYFVSAEHQGAVYSASLQLSDVPFNASITVFDATTSTDVLTFESYSVIVTGADANDRIIEVLERAAVRNDSGYTLVPDFTVEGAPMLSFLRFALPPGATNLDVRSNLVGGDVLEVDRGFAISTPVPPTLDEPHQFEFIYRLTYDGDTIDLSRTMRFGAESFRYVVPGDTGFGISADLDDLGTTDLSGRAFQLLETRDVPRGHTMDLHVTGLPQPTLLGRIANSGGEWYLRYAIPGAMAVALAAALLWGWRRRSQALASRPDAHALLLRRAAELEQRRGSIPLARYERERAGIKRALVDLGVRSRFPDEPNT